MTRPRYSRLQIALHWAIAALILANYWISDGMGQAFDATLEGKPVVGWVPQFHVYAGLAVLALVLLRLATRFAFGAPKAVETGHRLLDIAGHLSHLALYGLMLAVPVLGAVTWYGGLEATANLHVLAMNAMMLLVLAHAAAALFHQYVLKDGLLRRMMPQR